MHVPLQKQDEYLIACPPPTFSDSDLLELRDDLTNQVGRFRARGVIIDVAALEVIDSFATRTLCAVAEMLKKRGAETVVVGIHPNVAGVMVQMGLNLTGVDTAADVEEGLAHLDSLTKRAIENGT